MDETMHISPKYTVSHWKSISFSREEDWQKAIEIFLDRIEGRFLRYIRQIENDSHSGFVIMSLDCLLIETLQQFYKGVRDTPKKKCRDYFVSFLTRGTFGRFFTEDMANKFYDDIRNGILHQAEIKGSSKILITKGLPLVNYTESKKGIIINRKLFHQHLLKEVENYISKIKNQGEKELRNNFRKKMNYICQISQITSFRWKTSSITLHMALI